MQVYDVLPFQVGPFLQSGLVPLVLAPIWVLYGYLQPLLDNLWPGVSLLHRSPANGAEQGLQIFSIHPMPEVCAMFGEQRRMIIT